MKLNYILLSKCTRAAALAMLVAVTGYAAQAEVVVHSRVDSTSVTQGDRVMMHVEVVRDEPGKIIGLPQVFDARNPATALDDGVELREITVDSSKVAGTDRIQVNYELLLQAFDPKIARLPHVGFVTRSGDTIWGEALSLKVNPVDLDTLTDINPMAGTATIKGRWSDVLPDFIYYYWWIFLLALIVVAAAIALAIMYKKNGRILPTPKRVIPPYDWAMQQLERLKEAHLIEKGHYKEYYTHLVDILRKYLQGRFGINAMEMTSRQIIDTVKANEETRLTGAQLQQLLQIADFVKFARVSPLPDENVKAYNTARQFVEDTKPAEDGSDASDASDNSDASVKSVKFVKSVKSVKSVNNTQP